MNATRFLPALVAGYLLLGAGCSREQRTTRIVSKVDRHLAAGDLAAAELECRNLLQLDARHAGALRRLGLIYWDQGREHRAVPILRSALAHEPGDAAARSRLARFRLSCGDQAGAFEEAAAVLKSAPDDRDAPILLATAAAPDPDSQRRAREILHGLPDSASASVLVALGIIDLREGRTAAAEAAFHHALRADPSFSPAHHALGMFRWSRGDTAGAETCFKDAAEAAPPHSPHRERYVRFLLSRGKFGDARQLAESATIRTPDHIPSWLALADCAVAARDFPAAEAALKEAVRRDPAHPAALSASARLSLARGDPRGAVATLERLRSLHPGLPQVGYELALASLAAGDTGRAVTLFDEVIKAAPALREAALARAELSLRRGDAMAAAAVLEPLVRDNPDLPAGRALLAAARWGQGRPEEALALCLELERVQPASAQAPFWRGVVLAGMGRHDDARKALEKALTLAPGDPAIIERRVELELAAKQPEAAVQLLEQELTRTPSRLEPALLLARVHSVSGSPVAAERVLIEAAQRHADSPVAHYALALFLHTRGGRGDALAPARRALELEPRSVAAALLVAELEDASPGAPFARVGYERVLALRPDQPAALVKLAGLLLAPPADPDRALGLAERARELRPDDPAVAGILGTVLSRRGETARALPLLRFAVGGLPRDADLQAELARVLLLRGDEAAARLAYQRALEFGTLRNGDAAAKEALALLALPADPAPPEAEPLLNKRIAAGSDDPPTRVRLASILLQRGESDEALRNAEAALAATPLHATAALLAARIHTGQGRAAQAIEILKSARTGATDEARLTRELGRLVLDHGTDHPWALSLLQEAARQEPGNAEGDFDLNRALYANGRVTEALRRLDASARPNPGWSRLEEWQAFADIAVRAEAEAPALELAWKETPAKKGMKVSTPLLWLRVRAALARREIAEAGKLCEALLRAWPYFHPGLAQAAALHASVRTPPEYLREPMTRLASDPAAAPATRREAGLILCRLGEAARGAAILEAALAANPEDPEALVELGRACLALGRRDDGRAFLRRALAADPPASLATAARSALSAAN